jgi:hypothetical protein
MTIATVIPSRDDRNIWATHYSPEQTWLQRGLLYDLAVLPRSLACRANCACATSAGRTGNSQ